MSIMKLTKENYPTTVKENEYLVINYWAEWCGPCQKFAPILLEASEANTKVKVGKINIDEERELAEKADIMSIPTTVFLKNGEIQKTISGVISPRELQKELVNLVAK